VRLVADTNSVISGLLWNGPPARLIDGAVERRISLFTSLPLLVELEGVLKREKFRRQLAKRGASVGDVFDGYAALVEIVAPALIAPVIARDADDDVVLATAIAAKADFIVSGDAHLLDLRSHAGIEILAASELLARLA
jgi:putative PIN family toxin of toxin-antitoxin system